MTRILTYLLAVSLLCFLTLAASAQVSKRVKKGRRNRSESLFALSSGDVELDWELGLETINPQLQTLAYPNLAARYGINSQLEVNMEFTQLALFNDSASAKHSANGMEPLNIGFNYLLIRDGDHSPALIFSAQVAVPWMATGAFRARYYAPTLELILQRSLRKHWTLGLSGGVFWDGFSRDPYLIYNGNAGYQFFKKWVATVEVFSFIGSSAPQHNADLNLSYQVTRKLSFGVTAGKGLNPAAHQGYFSLNGIWGWPMCKKMQRSPSGS